VVKTGPALGPNLQLQSPQKIPQNLIVHIPVVGVALFAKEGAQLVLAEGEISLRQDHEHVVALQVQSDLQLSGDDVVVDPLLGNGLGARTFAAPFDDQAVEERGQFWVTHGDVLGTFLAGEPLADLFWGGCKVGSGEDADHLGVAGIEHVAQAGEDVIVGHNLVLDLAFGYCCGNSCEWKVTLLP